MQPLDSLPSPTSFPSADDPLLPLPCPRNQLKTIGLKKILLEVEDDMGIGASGLSCLGVSSDDRGTRYPYPWRSLQFFLLLSYGTASIW